MGHGSVVTLWGLWLSPNSNKRHKMQLNQLIDLAFQEDFASSGDITTNALVDPTQLGYGFIVAKEDLVLAGLDVAEAVFKRLDLGIVFTTDCRNGDFVTTGVQVLSVAGPVHALLKAERTALNFLQRLSGIATHTREYTGLIGDLHTKLADTRKTTPGWRALEKEAVRLGGGVNHRMGLYDGLLIKDNHIKTCGSIIEAVKRARAHASHFIKVEVETTTMDEVRAALEARADIIMLDNMCPDLIRQALTLINGKALTEISGGINLHNLREYAELGADLISMGALTHGAKSVDLNMTIYTEQPDACALIQ